MTLHGVDIYLWTPETPDLPKEFGPFKLVLISNRGTRVYPPPAPEMELMNWPRARYISDAEVSDAQIDELVRKISSDGWRWTKCQKLFRLDGVDQFSQPY